MSDYPIPDLPIPISAVEAAAGYRTFGLPCAELGPGIHDFVAVSDLPEALRAAFDELGPVLDLLERVVTTTSVDGCRTLQGDIEAFLREHGRLK